MTDYERLGRRGKPQREIYTPGSGPLRKSGNSKDEVLQNSGGLYRNVGNGTQASNLHNTARSIEINKITEELIKISMNSGKKSNPQIDFPNENETLRRPRKPDCELYIPKAVAAAQAQSREKDRSNSGEIACLDNRATKSNSSRYPKDTKPSESVLKNEAKHTDRRKRDKKRRDKVGMADKDKLANQEKNSFLNRKTKSKESLSVIDKDEHRNQMSGPNRFLRHGSEPPLSYQENRNRDTRSADPGNVGHSWGLQDSKPHNKPPPGHSTRRNSGLKTKQLPPAFESLPPRLQKKYMAENGIDDISECMPPKVMQHLNESNSSWDGTTLTFQGRIDEQPAYVHGEHHRSTAWSKTLPNPGRGRGRGRIRKELDNNVKDMTRSLTPDKLYTKNNVKNSSLMKPDDTLAARNVYSVEEKENVVKDALPVARCEADTTCASSNQVQEEAESKSTEDHLDWAAEVERCEEQDKKRLSRTNSRESLVDRVMPPPREKKRRRKRRSGRDRVDRSLSRDRNRNHQYRRGSVDDISNHSRSNSIERNWRARPSGDSRSRQNSSCDNRSRQSSLDRRENFSGGRQRSRKNSSCDNRSRHNSVERRDPQQLNRNTGAGRMWDGWKGGGAATRQDECTNWRLEQQSTASCREPQAAKHAAGILVLPQPLMKDDAPPPPLLPPSLPTAGKLSMPPTTTSNTATSPLQRRLYDPSNPDRPIVVPYMRAQQDSEQNYLHSGFPADPTKMLVPANDPLAAARPIWYNPYTENFQKSHNPQIIRGIEQADCELQYLLSTCQVLYYWERMQQLRYFLKESLMRMLLTDLRFCQAENVEQHLWKILYYNVIELLRKLIVEHPTEKDRYKKALLTIIDEGTEYYEKLLSELETTNHVKLETFLNGPVCLREGLGYTGLALIAAQKIYLCLGDLARYKEQANETCNYGVARQWYMKAHQINPKNGRPYNQLAILAMYTKRKLDAVYYYMRCLMSSNPMLTARESLISLFDDNRKKYEAVDRKRKEERARKEREKMKEKEGSGGGYRREIWIHPGGGKNVHRTTSTCAADFDSEDEELYSASNIEVNKRFCMSYLHVHGKIFTKIGLESLTETSVQMLREFRALLQHSPIPLNSTRFLQLFALNMFAIEITQPKGDINKTNDGGCYRSALQESALVVSLQMFNLLLEKFVKLLQDHIASPDPTALIVPPDCQAILPALKVWCDWLMTHVEVWNPPPSCQDYKVGPPGDCWNRIATLVNLLEKIDYRRDLLSTQEKEGYELVYLPEDATLSGFTPLMANSEDPIFAHKDSDVELAQISLRVHKVLFFGSVFLCGLDPPVLKLHKLETGLSEYISVVDTPGSQEHSEVELCVESVSSSEESDDSGKATGVDEEEGSERAGPPSTVHSQLIQRKGLLESRHRRLQARHNSIQKVISQSEVMTEMEVRPHDLVPDTNCFIDCLPQIEALLKILPHQQHPYIFMVPLVVVNELEGLSRGCKPSQSAMHSAMVRETARAAMTILQNKHPALRCVTTRGTVLNSSTFIIEEDTPQEMKNDDKILTTCLNLCRSCGRDEIKEGGRRKLYREVVLLTEDKSLRLKAISRDMPVRALPDFIKWAGLG
ncbi:smg6 nonsense mediated mRNA decay factor isoform X3 [Rhodnius prolixus]